MVESSEPDAPTRSTISRCTTCGGEAVVGVVGVAGLELLSLAPSWCRWSRVAVAGPELLWLSQVVQRRCRLARPSAAAPAPGGSMGVVGGSAALLRPMVGDMLSRRRSAPYRHLSIQL